MNISVSRERGIGGRAGYTVRCYDVDGELAWTARAVAWGNGRMLMSATGDTVPAIHAAQRAANALLGLVLSGRIDETLDSVSAVVVNSVQWPPLPA